MSPTPGVTMWNFSRMQKGMPKAEVEQIFGQKGVLDITFQEDFLIWRADEGSVACIWFVDDCVFQMEWLDTTEPLLDKIRRWLHLPWRP